MRIITLLFLSLLLFGKVAVGAELIIANAFDDGSGHENYPSANVIDGVLDFESRWAANGSPANLTIQLQDVALVSQVGIAWGRGNSRSYTFGIFTRADNSGDWTLAYDSVSSGTTAGIEYYDIPDIEAQQILITTHENSAATAWTDIVEVEVQGSEIIPIVEPTIASVFDDGSGHESYQPANVIDGDLDFESRWASDGSPANLTIQLQDVALVSQVGIAWGRGNLRSYTFEVYTRADTSGDWTLAYDNVSSGTTAGIEYYDIPDIAAQQILITTYENSAGTAWTDIVEVAVKGADIGPDNVHGYSHQSYGIFVHYGYGGTGEYGCQISPYPNGSYPQSVDETANNFDVQGFADEIAAMSPEYLIFTAWHCGMYPLYPSDVMTSWLGAGHSSQRDVLQELLDAFDEKNIDVYFYIQPSEAHDFSPEDQAKVGYVNRNTQTETYNNFINEVIAETTERYKSQFKGFWFDKGLSYGCTDTPRIGETVRAIMPDAVLIANTFANESADYGAVETKLPNQTFEVLGGYPDVENYDENTWPAWERSVSFVEDRSWAAESGSIRYTSEQMYKYTVLQAGVNEEGGGVAWAMGQFADMSWNSGLLSAMAGLGAMIDEVGESIKGTAPSDSWPNPEGTRLQELIWGIATRSADGNNEYLHVLKSPSGSTLTIDLPADGREYTSAVNLRTGNAFSFSQTANNITITLHANDSWDAVDTVIKLQ